MPDAPQSREAASANQPAMFDAYAPPEMARRVETVGVAKAAMPLLPLVALSFLAGAFFSLGAMLFTVTVTVTESGLGLGPQRLLGGLAFSLGLILVVVGGAELFTGNSLIVMAWAHRKVTTSAVTVRPPGDDGALVVGAPTVCGEGHPLAGLVT